MMTTKSCLEQKPKTLIALWALIWGLQLTVGVIPAWAQRRRSEPEATPSFSGESAGGPGSGGGPVEAGGPPGGGGPFGVPNEEESESGEGMPPQQEQQEQRVQIGAEQAPPPRPAAPTNPLDTRIVVRVKNAPLSTFLDTISAQAKVNFIITEGLEEKRVTAFLQNVSVREALQILLEIKGLTYQRIGRSNTYVVSPRAKGVPNRITRIYTLNHIPFISVDAGTKSFAANKSSGGGGGGGGGAHAGGGGGGAKKEGEGSSGIAVVNVIASVLSKKYGKISVDARTNAIIVTDIPEVFPQVEQILAELDRKAPQVMIEAQIVEINSDRAQQLGLEWGGSTGELATFAAGARDTTFPMMLPQNITKTRFFNPVGTYISRTNNASATIYDAPGAGVVPDNVIGSILDLTSLSVVLRALVSRAEARFLGKPKILTLNNKPALIEVSQQQAVSVEESASQTAGGSSSGSSAERFQTGLTLRVTPQVNSEGYITMFVEPSFTNVIESKISSLDSPVFDPVTRGASTLVRVKNGQTLVLGGLLESRETKTVRKVPFLGYIPLIGWFFTSNRNQRTNTDLVIFITPTIVTD
ncbi:MAG: secretin N-terminal domain-containing protein [Elusimicrobiota bacterium]